MNCKHRKGTVNGVCFQCLLPIKLKQLKYSKDLERMLTKEESMIKDLKKIL